MRRQHRYDDDASTSWMPTAVTAGAPSRPPRLPRSTACCGEPTAFDAGPSAGAEAGAYSRAALDRQSPRVRATPQPSIARPCCAGGKGADGGAVPTSAADRRGGAGDHPADPNASPVCAGPRASGAGGDRVHAADPYVIHSQGHCGLLESGEAVRIVVFVLVGLNVLYLAWAGWIDTPAPVPAPAAHPALRSTAPNEADVGELAVVRQRPPRRRRRLRRRRDPPVVPALAQPVTLDHPPRATDVASPSALSSTLPRPARGAALLRDRGLDPKQRAEQGQMWAGYWVSVGCVR